jgi:type IV pilus assembly protein PilQ
MTISTLIFSVFLASAQLISVNARDMELSDFFRLMADMLNTNIVLHPAVQGKVNVTVTDAPLEQVLDVVLKNHGLEKETAGNIIRIVPAVVIEAEQKQRASSEAARLNNLPLRTQIYFLKYAKADEVAWVIAPMLSPRGSVIAYRPKNAIIVTDVVRPADAPR